MSKKIPQIGIITCVLYFIAVGLFLVLKTDLFLTVWELFTVFGAIVILFVLIQLSEMLGIKALYKNAMLVLMSCACALTAVAHVVNITVTRRLIGEGVKVPTYLQIGYWPSVEMAVDYLAWGFFVGLAFLCVGISVNKDKNKRLIKIFVLVSAALCLVGFCGAIFINENIWYVAPMGYGFGTIAVCIQMLKLKNIN